MIRARRPVGLLILAGALAGCGGGTTEAPPEQKAADYGQKSVEQMKNEVGVPTADGTMKK